ncbi:enoyl-CoA hydratase/isomerase family protein [Ectobacillus funiculus]|jgi:enoyl-CoA hydratase/carnithine racemase|uniref:Ethylmalonyl-CoA decarboxylase n=1 Tax=Ectobacillus funiculus TaxID=137993 RepID=A0ABV5WPP0_9BACI
MQKIIVEREQGIVWATFNRPERRNAIDFDVMDELAALLAEVRQTREDKALVLTGAGDVFCSGGDLQLFHGLYTKEEAYPMLKKMGDILYELMTLPKPTIALLNGAAVGGGCEIAIACDYRFAASTAMVGFVQGHLAITTGWGGAAMLFEKLRHDQAMTFLCSAQRFGTKEAEQLGFVHEIFEGDVKLSCQKWIESMLSPRVEVLSAYKMAAVRGWNAAYLKERMDQEIKECAALWESPAHHAAVASFLHCKKV